MESWGRNCWCVWGGKFGKEWGVQVERLGGSVHGEIWKGWCLSGVEIGVVGEKMCAVRSD